MDDLDKRLLTEIQNDLPVVRAPFQLVGNRIGLAEADVLARLERLKRDGLIRQISAIFDTKSLGYQSTLVAMKFDAGQIENAARIINQHPGVSHNYQRDGEYNIWFTIAIPPYDPLKETIERLAQLSGALDTMILPTLKLFKIGVKLDVAHEAVGAETEAEIYSEIKQRHGPPDLTFDQIEAVRLLQEDFPLVSAPFAEIARGGGFTEERLVAMIGIFKTKGYLRRIGAILNHRNVGFSENAMVVWQIPEEDQNRAGEALARFSAVSHCYQRPSYPNWPYSIYTMVHAASEAELQETVRQMVQRVGDWPRKNLYTVKEFKKTRLKYFTTELDEWWAGVAEEEIRRA